VLGVERVLVGLKNREVRARPASAHKTAAVIRQFPRRLGFLSDRIRLMRIRTTSRPTKICEDARFDAKLTRSEIPGEPYYPKRIIYYLHATCGSTSPPLLHRHLRHDREEIESISATPSQFVGNSAGVPDMVRTSPIFGTRIGTAHPSRSSRMSCWDAGGSTGLAAWTR